MGFKGYYRFYFFLAQLLEQSSELKIPAANCQVLVTTAIIIVKMKVAKPWRKLFKPWLPTGLGKGHGMTGIKAKTDIFVIFTEG